MGVMSGTLDLIQRGYAGSSIRDGVLSFDPRLGERLDGLAFAMQFRGDADPGDARGRGAHGGRRCRGLEPADQGGGGRRGGRAVPRKPADLRAGAGSASYEYEPEG